jgi:hypothetical protein
MTLMDIRFSQLHTMLELELTTSTKQLSYNATVYVSLDTDLS